MDDLTKKVPIVIPSYEPDERLITLLNDVVKEDMAPVIIVNDGSGPEYDEIFTQAAAIIEPHGGKYISYRPNRGKGRALKTAFEYIRDNMPDVIGCVTADSDGQHTPACIASIIGALIANPYSLILGVRKFDGENVPWKSRVGNNITIKVFSYVSGVKVSDTQTGLRGIPFDFMTDLIDCKGERFEYETQMLLECAGRLKIHEVPIKTVYDSKENHQTHFDPFKDSVRIYKILGVKFVKYIFASLSSFVVDIILFTIFCKIFAGKIPDGYLVQFSTICARLISATYNYIINYTLVFKSRAGKGTSLVKYAILAFVQMQASAWSVAGICFLLPVVPKTLIKCIVDTLLFLLSYSIQQRFVFASKKKKDL